MHDWIEIHKLDKMDYRNYLYYTKTVRNHHIANESVMEMKYMKNIQTNKKTNPIQWNQISLSDLIDSYVVNAYTLYLYIPYDTLNTYSYIFT